MSEDTMAWVESAKRHGGLAGLIICLRSLERLELYEHCRPIVRAVQVIYEDKDASFWSLPLSQDAIAEIGKIGADDDIDWDAAIASARVMLTEMGLAETVDNLIW